MRTAILALILPLSACTTAQHIARPNGSSEYLIQCNGMPMCYEKANSLCPSGYTTISERQPILAAKELRISCK